MRRSQKTITLRQALAEIDIFERNGELVIFSLSYVVTTGEKKGEIHTKTQCSKKEFLLYNKQYDVFQGHTKRSPSAKRKAGFGNHKRDRTLPLFDQQSQRYFKIKIWALTHFNTMRIIRPIYNVAGFATYPKLDEEGNAIYPTT